RTGLVPVSSHDIVMAVGLAAIQKGQSVPGYAAISKVTAQQRLRFSRSIDDLSNHVRSSPANWLGNGMTAPSIMARPGTAALTTNPSLPQRPT
ncbi:hypothetical protein, partial [Sphingomonas sp. Sph1(2015)]|uniref:hypothetical protein n=1 Tax=Sphingomonas sp. Sph1(2015) TaxID=1628084 RepID=UPI001A7E14F8